MRCGIDTDDSGDYSRYYGEDQFRQRDRQYKS
jgi:hypothetical protein